MTASAHNGSTPGVEHFVAVAAATELLPTPLVPEVVLHAAEDAYDVWDITARAGVPDPPVPYWSFPWPGGQAVSRYVLDHPDVVRSKRVLDIASGSGLIGLAAAKAGAAAVQVVDIDPFAAAAQQLNAQANALALDIISADILDDETAADVVLAGDVCYERDLTARMMAFLRRAHDAGATVLLGDPGRTYLPDHGLAEVATYDVPTTLALEGTPTRTTIVWRLV